MPTDAQLMLTDGQLRDKARHCLQESRQFLERDGFLRMMVILVAHDGSEWSGLPVCTDAAGREWVYRSIADAARRLESVAALVCFDGVYSSHHEPGTWRQPGQPLAEDEFRCITVALKGPWVTAWSCMAPYAKQEGVVAVVEEREFEGDAAPWLPDWWLEEATVAPN